MESMSITKATEAITYVWKGAIPLHINLHPSQVTTHPPPPPFLILAPRVGYLPLLAPLIKPLFSQALPPGDDTFWFDYKGLPLKWYLPTGVLFDLLCAEPERPWNLMVHFRNYPSNTLAPCEGEDSVKWSFINSLKEAAYIMNGNCKNIMNMSQSDQLELWRSVLNGNVESFLSVTSKLKLGAIDDDFTAKLYPSPKPCSDDNPGLAKTGRIPVRLYVRILAKVFDDLEDVPEIDSWEEISYLNRPVEFVKDEGKCFTLSDAMRTLLPEYFGDETLIDENDTEGEDKEVHSEDADDTKVRQEHNTTSGKSKLATEKGEIKLIRIQGIEPKPEIPFSWVVNNLMNPDYFLHICVYLIHPQAASL